MADSIFSNVTVTRADDGNLAVYVGTEKMRGHMQPSISASGSASYLSIVVPMTHVRIAEDKPLPNVEIEKPADNVIDFVRFREAKSNAPGPGDGAA
jgi:hypothetical protein